MKKRINLLRYVVVNSAQLELTQKLQKGVMFLAVIFIAVYAIISLQIIRVKNEIVALQKSKLLYTNFLLDNKDQEAYMQIFNGKQAQLSTFLADDANFLPYYSLLKEALQVSTQSPVIDSINIDKDRATVFTISFNSYDEMAEFLSYVESETFLKHFSEMQLYNFVIYYGTKTARESKKAYQLQFSGTFKEQSIVKNEKN